MVKITKIKKGNGTGNYEIALITLNLQVPSDSKV
jgi:hypothetical protein